ncbi:hypothetical protein ACPV5S_15650 [Vibrio astriarenae]
MANVPFMPEFYQEPHPSGYHVGVLTRYGDPIHDITPPVLHDDYPKDVNAWVIALPVLDASFPEDVEVSLVPPPLDPPPDRASLVSVYANAGSYLGPRFDYTNSLGNDHLWDEFFGSTIDHGLFTTRVTSGGALATTETMSGLVPIEIDIDQPLRTVCRNSNWAQDDAQLDLEFVSRTGEVIAVIRTYRTTTFTLGVWYGDSWETLIRANGTTSQNLYGYFTFEDEGLQFTNTESSKYTHDFFLPCAARDIYQLNVLKAKAVASHNGTGFAYIMISVGTT